MDRIAHKNPFFPAFAQNKSLLLKLGCRDFKARYAGTAFGALWAVLQPAVTVAVYAFVFSVGFRSVPVSDVPYVLWLIAALLPWLFFQDALVGATGCLSEYGYLIKKTVFAPQLLPFIKLFSALIAHGAFVVLALAAFLIGGVGANVYWLQLAYYILATCAFSLALGYLTAALNPFFKDTAQFVGVALQMLFWLTPIAWDIHILSPTLQKLMQLNPLFYLVQGYRDSLIGGVFVFQRPMWTTYFWAVTLILGAFSVFLFMRLKPQYADVI